MKIHDNTDEPKVNGGWFDNELTNYIRYNAEVEEVDDDD